MPQRPHQSSRKPRSGPPKGRRKPPPDDTGEERRFLIDHLKTDRRLDFELIDGSRSQGTVRKFNEDTIEIQTAERGILLRKSRIRYIEEPD